jgi:uncharacterized protein YbaR (Trm112 family)
LPPKGVVEAIPVCKDKAPQLLKEQADQDRLEDVAASAFKTRNPERGTPDVWEARQLADFNIRAAAGEKVESLETGELVTENGKQVYPLHPRHSGGRCVPEVPWPGGQDRGWPQEPARPKATRTTRPLATRRAMIRGALTVKRPL